MQDYDGLRQLGPGIWVRDGEWYGTAFRRRMTIMALSNGELVVHNAFILKDEDLAQLQGLGKIAAILMPNALHGDELGWMENQFPESQIFVPSAIFDKIKKKHRVTGTLESDWPKEWSSSILCLAIEGLRIIHESAFLHKASGTLILTDLVFNMKPQDFKSALERKAMAWNDVGNGFGPSVLCNKLFTRDLVARRRSIDTILTWNFDRIIMNHGHIIGNNGKEIMRKAFD